MERASTSQATVTLLRGLPGSGKTTYAQKHFAESAYLLAADDFWGPEYAFDPKRIGEAHSWCFSRYLNLINSVRQPILVHNAFVVHNTFISAWEISPYVLAATAANLDYEIITLWCDPVIAAKRNIHKVPVEVIFAMYSRMLREELPPFWKHRLLLPGEQS